MSHENFSRRRFLVSTGILTVATCLRPRSLFAESENVVLTARKRAETATITIQNLRGNVTALLGSGGNIGVLSGKDGKLIIDSGYSPPGAKLPKPWPG